MAGSTRSCTSPSDTRKLDAWIQHAHGPYEWAPIAPLFAKLEATKAVLPAIVDIGAGNQDMSDATATKGASSRAIALDADPSEACARDPHHGENLQGFVALEYAPELLSPTPFGASCWPRG